MRWLDKLERRYGRYAVPNVTLFLIVFQVIVYFMVAARNGVWMRAVLIPARVLDGEFYRLFTFPFLPPNSPGQLGPIWAFFYWYLFYLFGRSLEHHWGTFRYNIYLLIGYVLTVAAGFLQPAFPVTNGYWLSTVFLAFAFLNPSFVINLMFIFPVQIVWLAAITWVFYVFTMIRGYTFQRYGVLAATITFLIFFGKDVWAWVRARHRQSRSAATAAATTAEQEKEPFHRCHACDRTDLTHPEMTFRYCSDCAGQPGYCEEHITNHEHVRSKA